MDFAAILGIEFVYAIASLALVSAGLAVIFGMMRIINFAHGEFMMFGAFSSIIATDAGINFWISTILVAPLVVGVFGMIVERILIRRLYGQMIVTLLATWGLSFFLIGLATALFGNSTRGVSAPLGSLVIGEHRTSFYTIFIILVALVVFGCMFGFLRYSRAGLVARGTMQDPVMAAALGIDTPWIYTITFGVGSALTGLAGAVISPFAGVVPTMGLAYVAKAFITVITGGLDIVVGTAVAAVFYGLVNQSVTFLTGPIIGEVALLIAAIVLLRVMPRGISGRWLRGIS